MQEGAICLMAIAGTRENGYVDVPPSELTAEMYEELVRCGHCVSRSDHLWMDGWRVYSPRAVREGLYRAHIPASIHTQIASPDIRVPYLDEIEGMSDADIPAEDLKWICDKSRMN